MKLDPKGYAQAAKLYATRHLASDLEGEIYVDALRQANEELMEMVQTRNDDDIAAVYIEFVSEWFERDIDEHLVRRAPILLMS